MLVELIEPMGLDSASVTGRGPHPAQAPGRPGIRVVLYPNGTRQDEYPDQQNLVVPFGIQLVVGFGWLPITGEAYIVIPFCKAQVSHEAAAHLRRLASSIAVGLMSFEKRLFPSRA